MSEKMTCPGCGSHSSTILTAFTDGRSCPQCGLSASAALEIQDIRQERADRQLRERCETLTKELDEAKRELGWARSRLEGMAGALRELLDRADRPLKGERGWVDEL